MDLKRKFLSSSGDVHGLDQIAEVALELANDRRHRERRERVPPRFARSWHILMKGSIVSAAEGDPNAAQRAKSMAQRLIEDQSYTAPAIAALA